MAWLLEIGQRLRAEYDDMLTAPLPERLAALLKQLESSAKESKQEISTSTMTTKHESSGPSLSQG
jgi:hypothetical protein